MTTARQKRATATEPPSMDLQLEVAAVPVTDADRAKQFYTSLGWREDADIPVTDELRILQFTPAGSQASVLLASRVAPEGAAPAGSLLVAAEEIEAARADLIERGVDVSEISKGTASFSDPDGNQWSVQAVTTRPPRETGVAMLAGLLLETALHHGRFEAAAPAHDWWDWYAPYLDARRHGSTPGQATEAADRYMSESRGVVASR